MKTFTITLSPISNETIYVSTFTDHQVPFVFFIHTESEFGTSIVTAALGNDRWVNSSYPLYMFYEIITRILHQAVNSCDQITTTDEGFIS